VSTTTGIDIELVLDANLDDQQRAAARDPGREVLTLACAGSGKSRTLAFRIASLVARGSAPAGIVAFTFTDKAAEAIKLQVARALRASGLESTILGAMYIGTIHSYCQNVLWQMDARYRQFDVLDDNRLKLFLMSRYSVLGLDGLRARRGAPQYFETIKEISEAWKIMNDESVRIEDVATHDAELGAVLQNLRIRLDRDQYMDFSLMIRCVVEGLQRGDAGALRAVAGLEHLLVDEYQDVNPVQEELIRLLHGRSSTLFVVGDDDQAVYAWRGADVSNILTFQQRYPGCSSHTLSLNYRSTPAVVIAADGFAAAELGASRIVKNPSALPTEEPRDFRVVWFNSRPQEAAWIADRIQTLLGTSYREQNGRVRGLTPGDFAILMRSTRSNEQDQRPRHSAFTQALTDRGIDYSLEAGGGVFERPHAAVLRDSFELLRNGSPHRITAQLHFDTVILPVFQSADFDSFVRVLADWGRRIHAPVGGARQRLYPQQLVHDLLNSFGIDRTDFDPVAMRDLGVFSRMMQDVETVYLSIDSADRFGAVLNFLRHVAETGYDTGTEDILRRPDVVTVSTVHKVKGLEFPVVFVADVEAGRFPGIQHNYRGWLPSAVIQDALARGAYRSTPGEEARLFYTALTRAERFLHVAGSGSLPGGNRTRRRSPFALRLAHPEISTDASTLPGGLVQAAPSPRVDEAVVPTSYSDIRYYLRCPADYRFRKSFGFSPPIPEMFGFGLTVHACVGKLHEVFTNRAPSGGEAEDIAGRVFHLKHVPPSSDPVARPGGYERARERSAAILRNYVDGYETDFSRRRQVEVRFEVPVEQAVISGAIDLLLEEDAAGNIREATVVDFKVMEGGTDAAANEELHWTELALQVQLYAKAAREVLGENARTGAVHLLKDNQRVDVPVDDDAVEAAVANVEWAVARILAGEFPRRPHAEKCEACDFKALCPKTPQGFASADLPPPLRIPGPTSQMARVFSQFEGPS
jgi:DNA helicase-2/ATP-dependent DNA helicase PcrA